MYRASGSGNASISTALLPICSFQFFQTAVMAAWAVCWPNLSDFKAAKEGSAARRAQECWQAVDGEHQDMENTSKKQEKVSHRDSMPRWVDIFSRDSRESGSSGRMTIQALDGDLRKTYTLNDDHIEGNA